MNDASLKSAGMNVLVENLGIVEAERFITLIIKEPFDYTKWRSENLYDGISIEELNRQAINYWNNLGK